MKEKFKELSSNKKETALDRFLNYFLNKPRQKVLRQVRVQIVEIPWLNNDSPELISFLAELHDHQVFKNELIRALLLKQDYTMQIVL